MNILGVANYSKETVGLRQPDKIANQQFKLVYIYPMLFSSYFSTELQEIIRRFVTISFLREILISNSLNLITTASNFQRPNTDTAQLIGRAFLTADNQNVDTISTPTNYQAQHDQYALQNKVHEKTGIIKRYLETDPRTKKLLPYIELITLNNLITVPVISGTKHFSADAQALMFILVIAAATNTPLNKVENVDKIISLLKNTSEAEWFKLLGNLLRSNFSARERWVKQIRTRYPRIQLNSFLNSILTGVEGKVNAPRGLQTISRWAGLSSNLNKDTEQEQRNLSNANIQEDNSERDSIFNILKLAKKSLDDVRLNFRFMLDPQMLRNQIGLDISNSTMENTMVKLNPDQYRIFTKMHDRFIELLSMPGSILLSSVTNTLYPVTSADDSINFLELQEKHINVNLSRDIRRIIQDTISKEITNSLSSIKPDEVQEKIALIKSICNSMSDVDNIINEEFKKVSDVVLPSRNFSQYQFETFVSGLHRLASVFGSMNKRFESSFSQLILQNASVILKMCKTTIYTHIENFIRDITRMTGYQSTLEATLNVPSETVDRIYIPQVTDTIFTVFYFFFLYRLQSTICEYVQIIDLKLDTVINDVLSFPNYVLVIPMEILLAVYTAYTSQNLKNLLSGGNIKDLSHYNDNYVRGIIKFLSDRLKIPSIIVIDEDKKIVHYKFMYMSSAEKINYNSLTSFIRNSINS